MREKKLLNENSKVLDIGCGTGRHLQQFSQYTPYLHGVDISSEMLGYAKNKLKAIPQAHFFSR